MSSFLILDDNITFAQTLARMLNRRGFETVVSHRGADALQHAQQQTFDYATVDLHLECDSGLQWIAPLRNALPATRLLVLTGYASIATAVQAMKLGADNYLAKPANVEEILYALKQSEVCPSSVEPSQPPLPLSVEKIEWEHIQRILVAHDGNISSTARALNMHRRTLQRKLAKRPGK